MKKIFFIAIAMLSLSAVSFSQIKAVRTDTIKTPNALCELCKEKIERYVKQYDGVLEINVMIKKGITKVKYVTDRVNIEEIKTAIANVGFDADEVPASPDFYKLLPACCKKPEDGGVQPKKPVTPPPAQ